MRSSAFVFIFILMHFCFEIVLKLNYTCTRSRYQKSKLALFSGQAQAVNLFRFHYVFKVLVYYLIVVV